MSDGGQAPPQGWWLASDGRWYPPPAPSPQVTYPPQGPTWAGQQGWSQPGYWPPPNVQSADPGNGLSIAGIICGAIAFLFLPIILGPAGLILGGIGLSRKQSKAPIAIAVSACGLVVGMILGWLVASSLYG